MWDRNARYHEWLLPYLEGGLDEARRAQLEARLAADPALAAEAERLRRTLDGLHGAAARTPRPENAQVPADLWPHLRARLVLHPAPPPRASRAWWLAGVGAPAAAALIVAAFWLPGWHTPDMPRSTQPGSTPPPARRQAAPSPASAAVSGHPARGMTVPAAKPLSAAKRRLVVPEVPRPAPVASRPTPFDLPGPPPPMKNSGGGPLTPPAVFAPAGGSAAPAHRPLPAAAITPPLRQKRGGAASFAPPVPPTPPKPASPAPTVTLNDQNADRSAASEEAPPTAGMSRSAAGFGGGAAGTVAGAAPKETANGLGSSDRPQAKPPPKALNQIPAAAFGAAGQPLPGPRRNKTPLRLAAPGAPGNALRASDANAQAGLDSWQAALAAAVRPPLWGENEGEQQANQALMAAREAGLLDDLRARLEAQRAQSPRELATGRMLAAVYDFGFSTEAARRERRRIVGLEGAGGEDWFALAQTEERARNGPAARAAYRRALESPRPPSPFHAAQARGRS